MRSAKKFSPNAKIKKSRIYQTGKEVCAQLQKQGHEAYFVGGGVRDFLLFPRAILLDIDIATSALPSEIRTLFPNAHLVGQSFGVYLVRHRGLVFEVATFRKEGPYHDRRHPSSIEAGSFLEDSARRDFTINALYYDPMAKKLLDPQGGILDLENKIIRCVGNAEERLYEDSLRVLRAFRFAAWTGFHIETKTLAALQKTQDGLTLLPRERIVQEWAKVKNFKRYADLFCAHLNVNLFFPGLQKSQTTSPTPKAFHRKTPYPVFNFFKELALKYDLLGDPQLSKHIQDWPTTNQDKEVCGLYLEFSQKLPLWLKEHREQERIQFLIFLFLLKMHRRFDTYFAAVAPAFAHILNQKRQSRDVLHWVQMAKKITAPSQEIANTVRTQNGDPKYIALTIDYYLFHAAQRERVPGASSTLSFHHRPPTFDQLYSSLLGWLKI